MHAMLNAAYANGITRLVATPHTTPGIEPFAYETYLERLEEAQVYCDRQGWSMKIYQGAEVLYTPMAAQVIASGKIPTLAESQYVLVEFIPDVEFRTIHDASLSFLQNGMIPVLAHVERYRCLMHKAKQALRLKKELTVQYQVNCATVLNGRDSRTNNTLQILFREGLVDHVASDAHNLHSRPCKMREAYEVLQKQVDLEYAQRLVGLF